MNRLTSSNKHSMLTRIISALVMCLVGVPCLFLGGWFYFAAMIVMSILAIFEFIQASNKGRFNFFVYLVVFAMVILMTYSPFFFSEELHSSIANHNVIGFDSIQIPLIFMAVYLVLLFVLSLFTTNITVNDVCYLFSMGVYIAFTFICMMYIRYLPNGALYAGKDGIVSSVFAVFVVMGTVFNDIGAYFIGVMLGKHKMCPRISPNKTWEGFVGGLVFSFTFSFVFAYVMDRLGYPLLNNVLYFGKWWRILLLSLLMPIVGDIGDLMFSLIKRNYAIKDFGSIFPGHGGILDRIDSLSLVCITVSLITTVFINGWNGLL